MDAIRIAPPSFACVVAMDADRGIGLQGTLPWRLRADLQHFRALTMQTREPGCRNAVIMGRKTWDSIPTRMRPLFDRVNIVVTRNPSWKPQPDRPLEVSFVCAASSFDAATWPRATESTFVIGGGEIYAAAVMHPLCRAMYVTRIAAAFGCDTFLPRFEEHYTLDASELAEEDGITLTFERWLRST